MITFVVFLRGARLKPFPETHLPNWKYRDHLPIWAWYWTLKIFFSTSEPYFLWESYLGIPYGQNWTLSRILLAKCIFHLQRGKVKQFEVRSSFAQQEVFNFQRCEKPYSHHHMPGHQEQQQQKAQHLSITHFSTSCECVLFAIKTTPAWKKKEKRCFHFQLQNVLTPNAMFIYSVPFSCVLFFKKDYEDGALVCIDYFFPACRPLNAL